MNLYVHIHISRFCNAKVKRSQTQNHNESVAYAYNPYIIKYIIKCEMALLLLENSNSLFSQYTYIYILYS